MTVSTRRKPINPSDKAAQVAEAILRDLCFTSYSRSDVLRVARRIAKAYEVANGELENDVPQS